MAVGGAYVFPGFLTPVLTHNFSFQSHRLIFSHASAEVRGENTPERKVASTRDRSHNYQLPRHESYTLTNERGSNVLTRWDRPIRAQEFRTLHDITQLVENHPTTREIRILLRPRLTPMGITVYFSHEQLTYSHIWNTHRKVSYIASDEDIVENNYMLVILWSLSVIIHLIFPQCFFFISGAKSKNNLRGYIAF